jgi:hypothetical protein
LFYIIVLVFCRQAVAFLIEPMQQYFSATTNKLIAKAQEVAMELHYAEVNSYTLFLADCLLEKDMSSIRSFIFSNQADFHRFYQAQRLMMQYNFPDHSAGGQLLFRGRSRTHAG